MNQMTNTFRTTLCVWLGCLIYLNAQTLSAHADKPNIIVILTDDQGWGDLSVPRQYEYQHPEYRPTGFAGHGIGPLLRLPHLLTNTSRVHDGPLQSPHRCQVSQSR